MDTLEIGHRRFRVERAQPDDVAAIVALLADDAIGASRESDDPAPYAAAYATIDADPAHLLVVVRAESDAVVATLHLTLLPGLSRGAMLRVQVEAVRVVAAERDGGLGRALLTWAIGWASDQGAGLVQLTSDARRTDALRFYESLGFVASHAGLKLELT